VAAQFPEKLQFLFQPARYKVAKGGRGGAKSWGFARALLILGATRKLRVLCSREVQKSIKDSVHKLLSDQIESLGLGHFYEVLLTEIRGKNGTEILFAGLSDQTAMSIKSFEGIDIVWVEEAQGVTDRSWNILTPTIRKKDSEIWVSFNPDLDTDPTYVRFVENPPPGAIVVTINYGDNPWFPAVLEAERLHCLQTNPKDYPNIWEGQCKAAVDGAVYADEIAKAQEEKRVRNVPYDPALKVHVVWDLGWNDAMSLILVQRLGSEIRVIDYIEDRQKTYDWFSATLKERRWNWGKLFLPHDGEHKNAQTGKSARQVLEGLGWAVEITPSMTIEDGIRQARMVFPRLYIDREKCDRLIQCMKRYKRHIPIKTNEPASPIHDEWSHGADAFRYLAINEGGMGNEAYSAPLNYTSRRTA
jgi:phage terminase large subunit